MAELKDIQQKQAGGKNTRTSKLDQIKRLDEQVRTRIAEQMRRGKKCRTRAWTRLIARSKSWMAR